MSDSNLINFVKNNFSDHIISTHEYRDESTVVVKKDSILSMCERLKNEFGFTYLADLTAVDYLEVKFPRYEVVYVIHKFGEEYDENFRLRLKVPLEAEECSIDSVTSVWKGANWLEREAFDMFGIEFKGHPDPRRILMPEDYTEFPLRKDFDVRNREPSKISYQKALDEGLE